MTRKEADTRARELSRLLEKYQRAYFVESKPLVSDAEYDGLFDELSAIERDFPDLARPDSPTRRVGSDLTQELPEVAHTIPVLSLDKSYTADELSAWIAKTERNSGRELAFVCEEKIDGASMVLYYEKGILARAVTRGNGAGGQRRDREREDHRGRPSASQSTCDRGGPGRDIPGAQPLFNHQRAHGGALRQPPQSRLRHTPPRQEQRGGGHPPQHLRLRRFLPEPEGDAQRDPGGAGRAGVPAQPPGGLFLRRRGPGRGGQAPSHLADGRHCRDRVIPGGRERRTAESRLRDRRHRRQGGRYPGPGEPRIHGPSPAVGHRVQVRISAGRHDCEGHRDPGRPHRPDHPGCARGAGEDLGRDDLQRHAPQPGIHRPAGARRRRPGGGFPQGRRDPRRGEGAGEKRDGADHVEAPAAMPDVQAPAS